MESDEEFVPTPDAVEGKYAHDVECERTAAGYTTTAEEKTKAQEVINTVMHMHSKMTEEHALKAYEEWKYVKTESDVREHYKKWFPYFPDVMVSAIIEVLNKKCAQGVKDEDRYVDAKKLEKPLLAEARAEQRIVA